MPRILVVDDQPADAALALRLLSATAGWLLQQVSSGAAALDLLTEEHFDLILTDMHMPEMDGLALMKKVHEQRHMLPVVVMTSRGNESKAVEALESGAASYLPKSRLESDLVATCKRVLDSSRQERDQAALMDHLVDERFEILMENERSHVPALIDMIVGRCIQFRLCDQSVAPRIGVAIEEAVLNAMIHGNLEVSSELREQGHEQYEEQIAERLTLPHYRDRRLQVTVQLNRDECVVKIRDDGPGFNPDELPDPTDPVNLCRVSGRGILLMRAFLDEVSYNRRGNEVRLVVRGQGCLPNPLFDLGINGSHQPAGSPLLHRESIATVSSLQDSIASGSPCSQRG